MSHSLPVQGEDQRVLISSAALGIPIGLAVDWLHDRLYWTDSQFETIESSDLDGRRRTVVVFTGLDKPRDIVLDPERGCGRHTRTHACTHAHMYAYTHTHMHTHAHTYTHSRVCTHMYIQTYMHLHKTTWNVVHLTDTQCLKILTYTVKVCI